MDVFTVVMTLVMDGDGHRFVTAGVDNHVDPGQLPDLHEVLGAIELGKDVIKEEYEEDDDD